jgi:hypothetical protein
VAIERLGALSAAVLLVLPGGWFIARSLLAPGVNAAGIPGYWLRSKDNLLLRGYSPDVIAEREALLRSVYHCREGCRPEALAARLRLLGRPVALVFSPVEDNDFLTWLDREHQGRPVYQGRDGARVRLLDVDTRLREST